MAFLNRRLTRWMLMLVVVPVGTWALAEVADRVAARRGENAVTRALRAPAKIRHRLRAA
jgi:hypothetical protein